MSDATSGTIAVIDDDATALELLQTVLQTGGYDVLAFRSAKAAINAIPNTQVDLVITDLIMPDQEGLETLAQIRTNFPNIKVLVVSGYAEYLHVAKLLGADGCLLKPVEPNVLLSSVDKLTKK